MHIYSITTTLGVCYTEMTEIKWEDWVSTVELLVHLTEVFIILGYVHKTHPFWHCLLLLSI